MQMLVERSKLIYRFFSFQLAGNNLFKEKILFLILFCSISFEVISQPKSDVNLQFKNSSYSVYVIKIDTASIKKFSLIPNYVHLTYSDFIEENIANHDSNIFAINGCINNDNGSPLGLYISDNSELNSLNTSDGNGNFFLKPNGVISFTNKDVFITESYQFKKTSNIINAVQSGPMLVVNDSIHPAFNINSNNKNIRCGVGVFTENNSKYLVFSISNEPVTFYNFASLFKEHFHCKNALCLESTNSVMYFKSRGVINSEASKDVGSYIVYNPKNGATKNKRVIQMVLSNSGVYEVPVELNDVLKISFIYDSGASDMSISPDVALTLIRTGTITKSDFIGTQTYTFADGSTAESDVFILHEINIGGYILKNVQASIANSIDAPMLLGQSVMQRIGKLTVDNKNHTLTIE